ncbi:MAG TPA: hypothetical protein VGB96_10570, partial [Archangium sp.]
MTDRTRLLLYCIADAAAAPPRDGPGARGDLLRIEHGGLAAVASPLAEPGRVEAPAKAELLAY